MQSQDSIIDNETKDVKFYETGAIAGATFLGGPLVAGYLIAENYKALNEKIAARNSLILGIVTTIILFGSLLFVPDYLIDKIPNQIIPLIYTGAVWGIVHWKQGDVLKTHKENGHNFYSHWRSLGIGLAAGLLTLIGVLGYSFFLSNDVTNQYNSDLETFFENEANSLEFYDHLETYSTENLLNELDSKTLPSWYENTKICEEFSKVQPTILEKMGNNRKNAIASSSLWNCCDTTTALQTNDRAAAGFYSVKLFQRRCKLPGNVPCDFLFLFCSY